MKIAGVSMVRDAADVIALNVLHHLHSGVDVLYIVDNGSSDETGAILERAAREFPVTWYRDEGPFRQGELLTELARYAHREGADWIVPIDADEFWWCQSGDLHSDLASIEAVAVECDVIQFIQRLDVQAATPEGLMTMTRRVAKPVGEPHEAHPLVESRAIAFVEMNFPPKWVSRACTTLEFARGSHDIRGIDGPRSKSATIQCLHAPLRAMSVFDSRADHGARVAEIEPDPEIAWQARRWRSMVAEGVLDAEWAANSYRDDSIDVYGVLKPVIVDVRLRSCAERWIDHEVVRNRPAAKPDAIARCIDEINRKLDDDRGRAGAPRCR